MAIILHIITGLNDGGAEAVLYRLCATDRMHRHHVVSLMDGGKYGPMLAAAGIPVTTIDLPRGRGALGGLRRLRRMIRKLKPDVVQTWMYHADLLGGIAARMVGVSNIVWGIRTSTLSPEGSTRSTILVARLCAWLSRRIPRRIVCCAERAREVHIAMGYSASRMTVIPNGYNLSVFRPDLEAGAALRRELGIGIGASVIGFVARFDPQKDHGNLLQALALLRTRGITPICLLIGTGMEVGNATLAERITQTVPGDQVRLLGRRIDIPAVMNALDLHVMSSAFGEAFPNVLAEAMACGTPCVSTDVGDAAAILGDTGRLVPSRDPQALAEAIADMLAERESPSWLARQRAARNRIAGHFTISRMIERYHMVWGTASDPMQEMS